MEQITFQNISCYCLTFGTEDRMENIIISKHLMLLFNKHLLPILSVQIHFKTSHVIV